MDLDELVLGMAGEIVPAVIYKKEAVFDGCSFF